MKDRTFEDFMKERHANIYPEILDDDLSDHFSDWISEIQADDWLDYGTLYGREQNLRGRDAIIQKLK